MKKSINKNIAVLLAAYNGEIHILEQLESIKSQVDINMNIFISLDKSDDSTLEQLTEQCREHDSICLLPYGERYGSAGANFFRLLRDVDFSDFDYVAFADQDDIWLPNKIISAIDELVEHGADGYSSNVTAFWESGKKNLIKKDFAQKKYDYLFESPGPGCTFVLTKNLANALKKQLLEKKQASQKLWLHDWYCYSFARYYGYSWIIGSKPLMLYRQHQSNEIGANSGFKSFFKRYLVITSGDGFDKALQQAKFIGQSNILPIDLLMSGSRTSMLRLSLISFSCRRQLAHKLFFLLICLYFSIKGYKYNNG